MELTEILNKSPEELKKEANKWRVFHTKNVIDALMSELERMPDEILLEQKSDLEIRIIFNPKPRYVKRSRK